jgi:BMFP domain-containing protein YqiC
MNRPPKSSMSDKPLLEDLLALGTDMLSHLANARHELKAQAKTRAEGIARELDLVSCDEFDAAFAMLAKARDMQEDLAARVSRIESFLNLSSGKITVKTKKTNLPSVKTMKKRFSKR